MARKTGTIVELVRKNLQVDVPGEVNRLLHLAAEVGLETTPASMSTCIWNVRRERRGVPRPAPSKSLINIRVSELLTEVQTEMISELGFQPTLPQVVERLIALYRKGENG